MAKSTETIMTENILEMTTIQGVNRSETWWLTKHPELREEITRVATGHRRKLRDKLLQEEH